MGVELGIWQGRYQNLELPWLRWWDNQGNLLQTRWERCLQRATPTQRLAAKLRELNITPTS